MLCSHWLKTESCGYDWLEMFPTHLISDVYKVSLGFYLEIHFRSKDVLVLCKIQLMFTRIFLEKGWILFRNPLPKQGYPCILKDSTDAHKDILGKRMYFIYKSTHFGVVMVFGRT